MSIHSFNFITQMLVIVGLLTVGALIGATLSVSDIIQLQEDNKALIRANDNIHDQIDLEMQKCNALRYDNASQNYILNSKDGKLTSWVEIIE